MSQQAMKTSFTPDPDIVPYPDIMVGLSAWNSNPLSQVGSTTAPLSNVYSSQDIAGKAGCKSQTYTSWDCYSRSYVCCLGLKAPGVKATSRSMNVMSKRADITPDVPTPDELAAFSHTDRKMYNEGKKMYFRTIGLLSRKQTTQAKYTKLIVSVRKTRSVQEDAKIYIYGEGPYNLYDLKLNTELVTSSQAPLPHWALWARAQGPAIEWGPLVPARLPNDNRYLVINEKH
ncbi:hypothetical protein HHI36_022523 [Cryptolaemus montrouzieri]|uniref:Uncharacterized protein n=1 Tax=Cryptolaemus montrouzieri TaxID=559131 RepID=A0ABD2N0S9_9CUCU